MSGPVRRRPVVATVLAIALASAVAVAFIVLPGRGRAQSETIGCEPTATSPYAVVQIDTLPRLDLELAQTPGERELGLMYREELPPDSGMLFVYQSESHEAYWMYHTLISLSIAFIDRSGTIVDIKDMPRLNNPDDVQEASRRVYPSAAPYWYALEVNQGWFVEHGVGVGHQLMLCLGG
jgi:uncharacterized membrane protein (UPF0127 family)